MVSGIYKIECVENGRYYYGSASNMHKRWIRHKCFLRKNVHFNPIMQSVWDKHGEDSFRFQVIEEVPVDSLLVVEQKYLDEHVGEPGCMNLALSSTAPMKGRGGRKMSDEQKVRLSEAAKKQWLEKRELMVASTTRANKSMPPRIQSDEEKKRRNEGISKAWTPERRQAMSKLTTARNKARAD